MALTMAVIIDYQNVHLTGASLFLPGRPPEEGLIDPFRFACQLAQARDAKIADERYKTTVKRVEVFRGLPIPEDDPDANRRNQAQKAEWERGRHGVVSVTLRPLKYAWDYLDGRRVPVRASRREKGASCAPSLWPTWPARVTTTSSSSLLGTPISLPPSTAPPVPPERRSRPSSGSTRPIDELAATSAPRPRFGPPR